MSNSLWPHGLQTARLLCPWDFPGKNPGVILGEATPFSRGYSWPRDWTCVSCIARRIFNHWVTWKLNIKFSSVIQSCPTLCDSMDCSSPGLPVRHQLPEFTQTYVHWVHDAIQPSHSLSMPSLAFNLSQHQGLFKWVSSLHQVAKVLEFQLQHQSFQWIFRTDFL